MYVIQDSIFRKLTMYVGGKWDISVPSAQFCCEAKTALKKLLKINQSLENTFYEYLNVMQFSTEC